MTPHTPSIYLKEGERERENDICSRAAPTMPHSVCEVNALLETTFSKTIRNSRSPGQLSTIILIVTFSGPYCTILSKESSLLHCSLDLILASPLPGKC